MNGHCIHRSLSITARDFDTADLRVICTDCRAIAWIDAGLIAAEGWAGVRRALDGKATL